jgi:hypothetical protein
MCLSVDMSNISTKYHKLSFKDIWTFITQEVTRRFSGMNLYNTGSYQKDFWNEPL